MNKLLLSGYWARCLTLATAGLLGLGSPGAHGQALNYTTAGASNVAGTFTSIAAAGTPIFTANTDNANSAPQNIGFTFNYNGASFTQFVLSTNGFIKLGAVPPSSATLFYTPENTIAGDVFTTASAANVNIIAPFHCDLEAGTGGASYQVLTSGAFGSRVCTIQWTNVRDKAMTNTTQYSQFSFQAKLYEGSNRVELVYGPSTAGFGTDAFRYAAAGLKGSGVGSGQTVLFTKGSTVSWSTATPLTGNYVGNTLNYRQTVRPDVGRTFRFEPQVNNDATVSTLYTLGRVSQSFASPHTVRALITNNGTAAIASRTATLTVTGANSFVATQTVPALAAGASATVTFAAYPLTNLGTNTVTVSIPGDDNNSNNSFSSQQVVSTGRLAYTDPLASFVDGLGSGAANSLLYVKYRSNGPASITNITPTFFASTATTFQVQVYDASGPGGQPGSTPLYTSAIQSRPAAAGTVSVAIPNVPVNGDFYVATKQLTASNISLAYQTESPLRAGTFYFSSDGLTFTDLSTLTFASRLALEVTLAPAAPAPANNDCAAATVLSTSAGCVPTSGTTVDATQSLPGLNCGGFTGVADDDVWYRFTATSPSHAVTVNGNGSFDAVIDVRSGACPGFNIACADGGTTGIEVINLSGLTVGASYYVRVYSYGGGAADEGTFSICVTNGAAQTCATPTDLTFPTITSTSVQFAFTPQPGNTGYILTYTPTAGGTTTTVTPTPTSSPITITGLTPSTSYSYTFQALCSNGATAPVFAGTVNTQAAGTGPANDNPAGATVLAVSSACAPTASTNLGATTTVANGYANPGICGVAVNPRDVWFRFTTLAGQTSAMVTVAGNPAGLVRAFSASSNAGPFTELSCSDGGTNNNVASPLSLTGLTPNTTYYLSVSGFGSGDTPGNFTICVTGSGTATGPANNECAGATLLTPGSTCVPTNGTTVGATQSLAAVTCAGFAGTADDDVWYRFTATSPGHVVTVNGNGSFDAVIDVRSGTCPGVNIACADAGGVGAETVNLSGLTVGATYYVRVYSYDAGSTAAGTFTICITGGGTSVDAGVTSLLTLGQLPQALASPHAVQAVITNSGTSTLTNRSVTLTVSGANTFTNTQTIASLAPGASTTVTFAAYPLTNLGTNNLTVSVPTDGNAANNTQTFTQVVSPGRLAYIDDSQPLFTTGVGVGQAGGVLASRYTLTQPGRVTSITPTFIGTAAAGTTYQVRLYSANGAGGLPGTILYTSPTQTRPAGTASPVIAVPNIAVGTSFYVAIVELNNNVTLAYQFEDPLRPNTFYYQSPGGSFTLINTTTLRTRLALEANVELIPCLAATNLTTGGSITPTSASVSFTPASGAASYTVTLTPQGGVPSTQTITGSPLNLTGLTPGTTYAVSIVTNCSASQTSPAATLTFATPFPPCPAPTALAVNNVSTTTASVSFTPAAGATGYTVAVTPQGGTTTTQTATGSPVSLAGLTPGTFYTVTIRTTCSAGQTSSAASINFTTSVPCVAVTGLTAGSVTPTGATLTFTPPTAGATSFTVTYTPAGGVTQTQTATGSPVVLTGLLPGTAYTATVTTNCGGGQTSAAASTSFTTPLPPCVAATNLATGNITGTSASVSFTPASGATSYTVTYTAQGGTPSPQPATGSPVSLTGLLPGTTYTVSIVTNCAAGQTSPAATTTFTTSAPAPTNGTAGSITETGASISFTPASGATSYTVTYTAQGGTPMTMTVTGSPVALTGLTANTAYTVTIVANYPGGASSAPLTLSIRTLMVSAVRSAFASGVVSVYPNPAYRVFTLSLPALGATRTARVELINAVGQTVRTQSLALTPGGTRAEVDVTGLATGLYTVRVHAGAETAATRLTVE